MLFNSDCKINMLMPSIYADYHDKFIENCINTMESRALMSERYIMLKNKMNYILPANLLVKVSLKINKKIKFHIFNYLMRINI